MNSSRHLATRLGGWSVRHRAIAICTWLLVVVAATMVGSAVGQQNMTMDEYAKGDSAKALRILSDAGIASPANELILVQSRAGARSPAFRTAVAELVAGLRATGRVTALQEPYSAGLVSRDGHGVLVQFAIRGKAETSADRVQPVLDVAEQVRRAHPELTVEQFGEASGSKWLNDTMMRDFRRAEWTAVPLALGILLVAFGALLAAVIPVGLALTAFLAANGLLAVISQRMHVDMSAASVMLLVGLAVGVDYCLFYLRREREERAKGHDPATALRIAAATSGRSVLVSGLTVVVAMSGMFLSGMLLFDGFGLAAILVVLVAMLGSVTVLPALLSLLGDHVDFGRVPGLNRRQRRSDGGRVWSAVLDRVLARPAVAAALAVAFLLALGAPALTMHTEKLSIDKQLPADISIMQSYHHIQAEFPGGPQPARVVVKADDVTSPQVRAAVAAFTRQAVRSGAANRPILVTTHAAAGVTQIAVPLVGGTDASSTRALKALRRDVIPATLGTVAGLQTYVAGDLAFSEDFNAAIHRGIAPVLVFVLGLAFLLMLVAFRSMTIAAVSVLLNLLSLSAAFGVIVAVFQHGWGAQLVGTHAVGAIESCLPLFAFVILFGLSMDYHVFVVSRIREAHDGGMSTRDAVSHGIRASAGVVTSAAVIMVAVFAVFGTLSMQDFKQLGVGLAVAILLDATVVRAVLLPAVLTLLDERTWWLPRWLSFLPDHVAEPTAEPVAAATGLVGPRSPLDDSPVLGRSDSRPG